MTRKLNVLIGLLTFATCPPVFADSRDDEIKALREKVNALEQQLQDVKDGIAKLEKDAGDNPYRAWKDKSGEHSIEAKLLSQNERAVTLQRRDGKKVVIEKQKLCKADLAFLDGLAKSAEHKPKSLTGSATPLEQYRQEEREATSFNDASLTTKKNNEIRDERTAAFRNKWNSKKVFEYKVIADVSQSPLGNGDIYLAYEWTGRGGEYNRDYISNVLYARKKDFFDSLKKGTKVIVFRVVGPQGSLSLDDVVETNSFPEAERKLPTPPSPRSGRTRLGR